jgi:hypothetical protein
VRHPGREARAPLRSCCKRTWPLSGPAGWQGWPPSDASVLTFSFPTNHGRESLLLVGGRVIRFLLRGKLGWSTPILELSHFWLLLELRNGFLVCFFYSSSNHHSSHHFNSLSRSFSPLQNSCSTAPTLGFLPTTFALATPKAKMAGLSPQV